MSLIDTHYTVLLRNNTNKGTLKMVRQKKDFKSADGDRHSPFVLKLFQPHPQFLSDPGVPVVRSMVPSL